MANNPGAARDIFSFRLLMTRPLADSERFVKSLSAELRRRVLISPLLQIVAESPAPDLPDARGLIFTSSNGVDQARHLHVSARVPAYCVGRRTTDSAALAGWDARMAGQTADELVATLASARPSGPLLHLRGLHARGDVATRLSAAGIPTAERVIYRQVSASLSAEACALLNGPETVIAPLFSPRSAAIFAESVGDAGNLVLPVLSRAVADEVAGLAGAEVHMAAAPNAESMRKLVEKLVNPAIRVESGPAEQ